MDGDGGEYCGGCGGGLPRNEKLRIVGDGQLFMLVTHRLLIPSAPPLRPTKQRRLTPRTA